MLKFWKGLKKKRVILNIIFLVGLLIIICIWHSDNVCAERNIGTGWFDESTVVPDVDPVHDGGVCGAAADPDPLRGPGLSVIRRPRHHLGIR